MLTKKLCYEILKITLKTSFVDNINIAMLLLALDEEDIPSPVIIMFCIFALIITSARLKPKLTKCSTKLCTLNTKEQLNNKEQKLYLVYMPAIADISKFISASMLMTKMIANFISPGSMDLLDSSIFYSYELMLGSETISHFQHKEWDYGVTRLAQFVVNTLGFDLVSVLKKSTAGYIVIGVTALPWFIFLILTCMKQLKIFCLADDKMPLLRLASKDSAMVTPQGADFSRSLTSPIGEMASQNQSEAISKSFVRFISILISKSVRESEREMNLSTGSSLMSELSTPKVRRTNQAFGSQLHASGLVVENEDLEPGVHFNTRPDRANDRSLSGSLTIFHSLGETTPILAAEQSSNCCTRYFRLC